MRRLHPIFVSLLLIYNLPNAGFCQVAVNFSNFNIHPTTFGLSAIYQDDTIYSTFSSSEYVDMSNYNKILHLFKMPLNEILLNTTHNAKKINITQTRTDVVYHPNIIDKKSYFGWDDQLDQNGTAFNYFITSNSELISKKYDIKGRYHKSINVPQFFGNKNSQFFCTTTDSLSGQFLAQIDNKGDIINSLQFNFLDKLYFASKCIFYKDTVYIAFDKRKGESATYGTILLKFDKNLNLIDANELNDFLLNSIDTTFDGRLSIVGNHEGAFCFLVLNTDFKWTYELGQNEKTKKYSVFSADYFNYGSIGNEEGDIFITLSNSKNIYRTFIKLNKSYEMLYQKVIPYYFIQPIPVPGQGLYLACFNSEEDIFKDGWDYLHYYYIDALGNTDVTFQEYCDTILESKTFIKYKIKPYSNVINIRPGTFTEINPEKFSVTNSSVIKKSIVYTFEPPDAGFSIEDTICLGSCAQIFTEDLGYLDTSYYTINQLPQETLFCPAGNGLYDIHHYITYFGGCQDSLIKTVSVFESPKIDLIDSLIICDINNIPPVYAFPNGDQLQWSDNTTDSIKYFINSGSYIAKVSNDVCSESDTIEVVNVKDKIAQWPSILDHNLKEHCEGDLITVNILNPEYYKSFIWNNGSSDSTLIITQSGIVSISANYLSCSATDSINIIFDKKPDFEISDSLICDSSTGLEVEIITDASLVLWDNGSTENIRNFVESGKYQFTLKKGACSIVSEVAIENINEIIPDWPNLIDHQTGQPCIGEVFTIGVKGSDVLDSYKWQDLSTNSTLNISQDGLVSLYSTYKSCISKDSVYFTFKDCRASSVYVPNIFSPNYDLINDILAPNFINAEIVEMSVFNRWGALVFNEKPFTIGWDGTFRGKECENAVYVCIIEYKDQITGKVNLLKQDITLIR